MPITFCFGDLIKDAARYHYIVHQTNSQSNRAGGLAYHLFTAYPSTNNYAPTNTNVVGRAEILRIAELPNNETSVVNLCAQFYPGGPSKDDESERRKAWFEDALRDMTIQINSMETYQEGLRSGEEKHRSKTRVRVAFPTGIGCGLAGGYWPDYLAILERWAATVPFHVTLVESRAPKRIISTASKGGEIAALRIALSLGFDIGGSCAADEIADIGTSADLHVVDEPLEMQKIRMKLTYLFPKNALNAFMEVSQENIDEANATLALCADNDIGTQKCIAYATTGTWPFPNMMRSFPRVNTKIQSVYKPTYVVCNSGFVNIDAIVDFLHDNAVNVLNICGSRNYAEHIFLSALLNSWVRSILLKNK